MHQRVAAAGGIARDVTPGYRRYVLIVLMLAYAFNMLDRQIVTILAEPIKHDLKLADWQVGAVTGLAFALFYTVLGIPVARLADRANRVAIIAGSLAIWSGFTIACGFARGFPELLLMRMGVATGEAGCTPPAHSLITEYAPKEKRASALAFYSLGIPLGSLLGLTMGGLLADSLGWRTAFVLAGAPGLLLAAVIALTLKEPRRGAAKASAPTPSLSLRDAMAELRAKRSFWLVAVAGGFSSFVFYGHSAFYGSFFLRTHGEALGRLGEQSGLGPIGFLGVALGLLVGAGSGAGTYLGGVLADRAARRDISGYARLPALATLFGAPAFALVMAPASLELSLALVLPAVLANGLTFGPAFAAVQSVVRPEVRATAAAVLLFLVNIIGLGLGPLTIGVLSDLLAQHLGAEAGLRWSMALMASMMLVAACLFGLAARTIRQDEVG
ncbi:MFS transporter [Phenylobacterium sp.]|uniref:spinster family MFS transporter n=1 Tax=Phenylobacterium sp. TaxID=1871053 RepID=UPI0027346095|nr:MFS transporter [Phenylobacterium sp.]MDP3852463.1 MFS transporter [Phenylobacterium sp.]